MRFKISSDIVSDLMMIILMEPMYVGSLAVTEGLRKDGSEELPPGVAWCSTEREMAGKKMFCRLFAGSWRIRDIMGYV